MLEEPAILKLFEWGAEARFQSKVATHGFRNWFSSDFCNLKKVVALECVVLPVYSRLFTKTFHFFCRLALTHFLGRYRSWYLTVLITPLSIKFSLIRFTKWVSRLSRFREWCFLNFGRITQQFLECKKAYFAQSSTKNSLF